MQNFTASTFEGFGLEDFDKFIKRAYRAFNPVRSVGALGDYKYLLYPEPEHPQFIIEVLSSIDAKTDRSRAQGTLSVSLIEHKGSRVDRLKTLSVKRTNNWKETVSLKIDELVELYLEKYDPTPNA